MRNQLSSEAMKRIYRCTNCLNLSTRPRVTFNSEGWCNACTWSKEKSTIDWRKRKEELFEQIKKNKRNSEYDCLVPIVVAKIAHM